MSAAAFGRLSELLFALHFKKSDLVQHDFDIFALLFEEGASFFELGQKFFELPLFVAREVVQIEEFADFRKGKPQPLAAQREFQSHPVAMAEEAVLAVAARRQETFVFIVPDGPGRDPEFLRQIGDGIGVAHCAAQYIRVKCH